MKSIKRQRLGIFVSPGSERTQFLKLVKAMDPNEVTAGYLEAIEKDAARLKVIELRLGRIEKLLVLIARSMDIKDKSVKALRDAQKQAEENPYVPGH